jgi:hypothetical protein
VPITPVPADQRFYTWSNPALRADHSPIGEKYQTQLDTAPEEKEYFNISLRNNRFVFIGISVDGLL